MTQTRDNRRSCRTGSEVLTLAAIGGLGLAAIIGTAASPFAGTNIGPEPKAATLIAKPTPARPGMADLVDRVGPSVVTIRTRQAAQSAPEAPPSMEEFFRRFFGEDGARQFRDTPPQPAPQSPDAQSLGSGFIIDRKGHIVTNNHVIGKAGEITVVLKDGKELKAKLVGRDAKTDLALIKVNAGHDLPFVSFGPSAKLRVGQWVMAMGNPFGLGQTVTAGIISARHRTIGAGPFDDFLQIDAAINQGNSGGPAFNLQGQVIGVNTAIFSPSGGNVGIGFAIPSDLVKGVIDDLMDDGKVARGLLGVQIQAVTPELAGILGLDKPKGALISNVTPKGPAAKAGFKRGDVITGVNGKDVTRMSDLPKMIAAIQPGDKAKISLWRDRAEKTLSARLGTLPENPALAAAEKSQTQDLSLAGLDNAARARLGMGPGVQGVLIEGVAPTGLARRQGLSRGDVIVAIGGMPVAQPSDVVRILEEAIEAKRKAVLLLVSRRDGDRFVACL